LDEIEKAHPDVFNILLQVLDDGRLTDSKGRVVDFKNTVLIMTSNIGSQHLLEGVQSDGTIPEEVANEVMKVLKGSFKPEFLNRIDDTILFTPLSKADVKKIIVKMVKELSNRLADKQIQLSVSDEVAAWIADNAYDPIYGARPLRRFISAEIENPLARAIIKGDIHENQAVTVTLVKNQVGFQTVDLAEFQQ
jgi:ATP-dependent Clp protease ATP-binding subunit ClpB